ncbi:hypothetical protein BH23VER1_BH23VER1_37370 [soil metagenome]
MTPPRLLAIALVIVLAAAAWAALGGTLQVRTQAAASKLDPIVAGNWGAPLTQLHPAAFYLVPGASTPRKQLAPITSEVSVDLQYTPVKKGLLRYRTYTVDFAGRYTFENPAPVTQTVYLEFQLPTDAGFDRFSFSVDGTESGREPDDHGRLVESVSLAPNTTTDLAVSYAGNGLGTYAYDFDGLRRLRAFSLDMTTDFEDIDIPAGAASPNGRERIGGGWALRWDYDDVIAPSPVGVAMPKILNPGPVAARISLFAPVSLLFYFAVLIVLCLVRGINLHPMNFAFMAAGCFAFQLLFTYLVDLVPPLVAFGVGASVSVLLVSGYLWRVAGFAFARLAALAQLTYMVLFSYSFFFDGLTGITITVGAVVTLAVLMAYTARVNWADLLGGGAAVSKSPLAK